MINVYHAQAFKYTVILAYYIEVLVILFTCKLNNA